VAFRTRKITLLNTCLNPLQISGNYVYHFLICMYVTVCRSQGPRGLRRSSAVARLLCSWVRIPPRGHGYLSDVSVVCFTGRGVCDELITRPEESYRLWCFVVCDLETSRMRRPWSALGRSAPGVWGGSLKHNINTMMTYQLHQSYTFRP
jgi:hypothetical protein